MRDFKTPRTNEAATAYLVRVAELEDEIGGIEARRNAAIAAANAEADAAAAPLLKDLATLAGLLEPWWDKAKAGLTEGKRKSIELGGCFVGTEKSRASLDVAGDEDAIVAKLQKRPWAAELLRPKVSIDKAAVRKQLDGKYKKQLADLGFSLKGGVEVFFVKRAEQAGTQASVQA